MAARARKAGPMRHRLAGRGGARNSQADILGEFYDELDELHTELCREEFQKRKEVEAVRITMDLLNQRKR